jgi:hypothetical protein
MNGSLWHVAFDQSIRRTLPGSGERLVGSSREHKCSPDIEGRNIYQRVCPVAVPRRDDDTNSVRVVGAANQVALERGLEKRWLTLFLGLFLDTLYYL